MRDLWVEPSVRAVGGAYIVTDLYVEPSVRAVGGAYIVTDLYVEPSVRAVGGAYIVTDLSVQPCVRAEDTCENGAVTKSTNNNIYYADSSVYIDYIVSVLWVEPSVCLVGGA